MDFDTGWRFGLVGDPMAMQPNFDDSSWRQVNVPHDWSSEGPFAASYGSGNGFAPGGIAWYRRHFRMKAADAGRAVTVEFDGIYDHAEAWLNGFFVGGRPYGFESFACDLTPYLKNGGEENILAVRVDHSRFADSRWYTGSGIYRNVRLCVTGKLHLGQWEPFVSTPEANSARARVRVETEIENQTERSCAFTLTSDVVDGDGQRVATISTAGAIEDGQKQTMIQELTVEQPHRWSPDSPALYTVRSRLSGGAGGVDDATTAFGIRTLKFDPAAGFFLNGTPTKLLGVCIHQDGGSVGVAIPVEIWERRLRALKAIGVNAIRTSHNPPAPEFLELCDRLGFLVMDEAFDEYTPAKNKWVVGWNQGVPGRFGYSESFATWSVQDISDMVRRDRNHPSVVMWSIGNEIDYPNDPFTDPVLGKAYRPGNPPGTDMVKWGRPLVAAVKRLDGSRPVTAALASVAMSNAVGFAQILDITGYNYQEPRYADDRRLFPQRVVFGSENKHTYAAWATVRDNSAISGQFLWTGIDYLGEARAWPNRANPDGLLDLCGFVKPVGKFRESLWSSHPMVYLCAAKNDIPLSAGGDANGPAGNESWNWPDQTLLTVRCYSNCGEVRLTLNDQPLGAKRLADAVDGVRRWRVAYTPGVLRATGVNAGQAVCTFALSTVGRATRIGLRPDVGELRADGKSTCQLEFDVEDAQGRRVPDAEQELTFAIAGPALFLGLGNGDISNSEDVKGPAHRAYQGRGLAIVQSTTTAGLITVRVSSPALQPAFVTLRSN